MKEISSRTRERITLAYLDGKVNRKLYEKAIERSFGIKIHPVRTFFFDTVDASIQYLLSRTHRNRNQKEL